MKPKAVNSTSVPAGPLSLLRVMVARGTLHLVQRNIAMGPDHRQVGTPPSIGAPLLRLNPMFAQASNEGVQLRLGPRLAGPVDDDI
ncbi:MAG: hypothetical protein IIB31_03635 [Chloroflexi bacterium]|nr:hypothetical protein [Chloroflexota bacterium]